VRYFMTIPRFKSQLKGPKIPIPVRAIRLIEGWFVTEEMIEKLYRLPPQLNRVLRLKTLGLSYKEIALTMKITEETTRYHLKRLRKRLGIKTTDELIVLAIVTGFVKQVDFSLNPRSPMYPPVV